jgi:flagellar motor switch protein FliN/FliY
MTDPVHVLELTELSQQPAANAPLAMPSLAAGDHDGARNPLHQVKTTLTVRVGTAEISVGELLAAKEQQVLRLDSTVDQPVDILLEGQVIARGSLVAVGDHFGVRITELPKPLVP